MTKLCKTCNTLKPLTTFYVVKKTGRPDSYCRPCRSEYSKQWFLNYPEQTEKHRNTWDSNNPSYNKEYLKRPYVMVKRVPYYRKYKLQKYGLTEDQYQSLMAKQHSKCAICKVGLIAHGKNTHTDHCHKTGRVRGLLCPACNQGLGRFKDDPIRLAVAIAYLKCS